MKSFLTRSTAVVALLTFGIVGAQAGKAPQNDIIDTAVAAGTFNTLATALKEAGLVDTLKGKGPFTVFAPTDEAFAKLPAGTVEDLLKPENKAKLVSILTYHVVSGAVSSSEVVKMISDMEMTCSAIHSDMRQKERIKVFESFRSGGFRYLVASDLAARGYDIQEVNVVINFDFPQCPGDYLNRVGRTGRFGHYGIAVSFVTSIDSGLFERVEETLSIKMTPYNGYVPIDQYAIED